MRADSFGRDDAPAAGHVRGLTPDMSFAGVGYFASCVIQYGVVAVGEVEKRAFTA
jgi:hypothetical protein